MSDKKDGRYSPLPELPDVRVAKWGIGVAQPVLIVGGFLTAAVIAVLHHLFDSYLTGKSANGFWDQTISHQLENAMATSFQIVFAFSAGISLCQVVSCLILRSSSSLIHSP